METGNLIKSRSVSAPPKKRRNIKKSSDDLGQSASPVPKSKKKRDKSVAAKKGKNKSKSKGKAKAGKSVAKKSSAKFVFK